MTPATMMGSAHARDRRSSTRLNVSNRTCSLNSHSLRISFSIGASEEPLPTRSVWRHTSS